MVCATSWSKVITTAMTFDCHSSSYYTEKLSVEKNCWQQSAKRSSNLLHHIYVTNIPSVYNGFLVHFLLGHIVCC